MMRSARLILDPPARGVWNMAVDEALLLSAGQRQQITLRIYRWDQPTLSLGYFQAHRQRSEHRASLGCPLVRRATGGGAIIHDQEVTYSLTAPVHDRWNQQVLGWYDAIHDAWVDSLGEVGCHAERCAATDSERESKFLCFERRAAGDLLLRGWKVGGSAQRRHRDAALQHGSLLLRQSKAAPELPGIVELTHSSWPESTWLKTWIRRVGQQLDVPWEEGHLTDQERALADAIVEAKFGNARWTLRR